MGNNRSFDHSNINTQNLESLNRLFLWELGEC